LLLKLLRTALAVGMMLVSKSLFAQNLGFICLFAKLPRSGDSEVTFEVLLSLLSKPLKCRRHPVTYLVKKTNKFSGPSL